MKKHLFRVALFLLAGIMAFTLTGCVSIEQRLLNAFKALQDAKACHLLIGVSLDPSSGGTPLKLDMDMAQSGDDYAMKGALTLQSQGTGAGIPFELYLKGGSMYMGTSVLGASSGSSRYIRLDTAEAAVLAGGGLGVDPQGMGGFLAALKGIDFKNVQFEFGRDTRTISGRQIQLDKVTLTPTPQESKRLIDALAGSGLASMVDVQGLAFTLWLGDAGIVRVECKLKASAVQSVQDAGGLIPAGPYDMTVGVDILELGNTLSLSFPEFTESNTLDMQQYIQQVTQDFVQDLPGASPLPSGSAV